MARRIKKFKNPDGPITQTLSGPKINVEGYGDITFDKDLSDFISRKRATFTGDQNISDQFDYVNELYKNGSITGINSQGIGSGIPNPSLTNKRALKMQKMFGAGGEDYARQQASKQMNNWIREYAETIKTLNTPESEKADSTTELEKPTTEKVTNPADVNNTANTGTKDADVKKSDTDQQSVNNTETAVTNETSTGAPKSSNPPVMLQRPEEKPNSYITDGFKFQPLKVSEGHNETQLNVGEAKKRIEKITDKSISDIHELSGADIADLSALGLDLVSMASAFTTNPIGSAVSAGTGAASSLITGYTDIFERDENVWSALGNTATNLGLDVVGALPWIGAGAGAAKLMKSVNKVQKILAPSLALMGATHAVSSLEKLNREGVDKMTINDWKALIDGVQAVATGKKMGEYYLGTKKALTPEMKKLEGELSKLDKNSADFKQRKKEITDKIKILESKGDSELGGASSGIKGKRLAIQGRTHGIELNAKKKSYSEAIKNFEKAKASNSPDLKKYEAELAKAKSEFKESVMKANSTITDEELKDVDFKVKRKGLNPIEKLRSPYKWDKENKFSWKNFQNPAPRKQKEIVTSELREWKDDKVGEFIKKRYDLQDRDKKIKKLSKAFKLESEKIKIDNSLESLERGAKNISVEPVAPKETVNGTEFFKSKISQNENIKRVESENKNKQLLAAKERDRKEKEKVKTYLTDSKKSKSEPREEINNSKSDISETSQKKAEKQTKKQLKEQLKGVSKMRKTDSKDSVKSKNKSLNRKNYEKLKRQFENVETLYKEPRTMTYDKQGNLRQITGEGLGFMRMRKDGGVLKYQLGGELKPNAVTSQLINNLPNKLKLMNVGSQRLMLPNASPLSKQTSPVIPNRLEPLKVGSNAPVQHIGETVDQSALGAVLSGLNKSVSPRNLKFLNTLATNAALMKKIKEAPSPTSIVAPVTTKLKAPGMSSYMNQFNELAKAENSQTPTYSDPKLEALSRLSRAKQIDDSRQQVGAQLQAANQQAEAHNAQLYSQDAATRANIAAQNAEQARQHKAVMNQYEQGLIRSTGQSIENLLSERQSLKDRAELQNRAIDEQIKLGEIEAEMAPAIEKLQSDPRYSKRATDLSQAAAYKKEMDRYRKAAQLKSLQLKRLPESNFLKTGGKISNIYENDALSFNKKLLSLPSKNK